jgi:glycosyltransferase involved in cell wall biosynthesis
VIRLLVANVFFSPRSFGGATIVAEEVAVELARRGYLPLVVTTIADAALPEYHVVRYRSKGLDVLAVNVPDHLPYEDVYQNYRFSRVFADVVTAFKPHLAHLHSVQRMGGEMANVLAAQGVPYCITAHDAWWLCERQFMINRDGAYCFQEKLDPAVCSYCVDEADKAAIRSAFLSRLLDQAARIFFPSHFHRNLYVINGTEPERAVVNRNGIRFPASGYQRHRGGPLTFGFVGGPGAIKGSSLILKAFKRLGRKDYRLLVVDAAGNLGKSWAGEMSEWKVPGQLAILDAYTQETMDNFFSRIDVLLFPSQWKESFGLTVREAMARDVWVIATNGGGTVEDIRDGENGEVIPLTTDAAPLVKAIERCFARDWSDYKNPYKSHLQTYRGQAAELDKEFRALIDVRQSRDSGNESWETSRNWGAR